MSADPWAKACLKAPRGQGVVNLNWIHRECGKLGITEMREGLLTGPYLVAGACGVSFLNEGRGDRESWNQRGGEGQRTKTITGKFMFSLKLKRKEMNPGVLY